MLQFSRCISSHIIYIIRTENLLLHGKTFSKARRFINACLSFERIGYIFLGKYAVHCLKRSFHAGDTDIRSALIQRFRYFLRRSSRI